MNISKKILLSTLVVAGSVASCTSGFDEINEPQNSFTKEQLRGDNYEIAASFPQLQQLIVPAASSGYFQHFSLAGDTWGRFLMSNTKWNNNLSVFRYMHEGWINTPFDILTNFYPEFRKIKEGTQGRGISYAWALINRVGLMHRLTDLYGPIPYTQIEGGNLHVPYDSQEAVYKAMLADLNTAITEITSYLTVNPTAILMKDQDLVYQGDFRKWVRFANSLKLRIAMRMRYADPATARKAAEEAVSQTYGVITENGDNAILHQKGQSMLSLITQGWNDARVAADLTSYMNGYSDPRRAFYFTASTFPGGGYEGIRSGSTQDGAEYTKYSNVQVGNNDPTILMTASEVAFLKAEAALIGWNMGAATAQSLYEDGIKLSFAQWGAGSATSYLASTAMPAAYTDPSGKYSTPPVSSITPRWDSGASTEENLERIITQKWIALWPLGFEAWCEHRRTGYPKFFPLVGTVESAYANMDVANRMPFSRKEYDVNGANIQAAVGLLGGPDNFATKMWWQKKN